MELVQMKSMLGSTVAGALKFSLINPTPMSASVSRQITME